MKIINNKKIKRKLEEKYETITNKNYIFAKSIKKH